MEVNWSFFFTSVLFNTLLLITFITIFFFSYVSKVEKQIVDTQVTSLIQDLNREMSIVLSAEEEQKLRAYVSTLKVDTSSDKDVEANNAEIRRKTYRILGIILAIGGVLLITSIVAFKVDVKELFITGGVSLLAVAFTEFIFATFFAKNYKTLDENYVKLAIINALQESLK